MVPQAKVIQRMHPAMEVVYKPLAHRWPYIADAIRNEAGGYFEDAYYSRVHMHGYVEKNWGVLYFVPRSGSAYLDTLLRAERESMDARGGDGIYSDEFSWAYHTRGYSRYDYSRWDGYSADLDAEGHVKRLKSDNAFTTESAQLQIVHEVLRRGKFFLGNGGAALRSLTVLPAARFVEGGNGEPCMAGGHFSSVPLVLGNFGDETTRRGIFDAVKRCLSMGCVYSPHACNLLLEGPDNFVCKLYPVTIRKLGPGWIEAEERLISRVSRTFDRPGRAAALRLYRYDSHGDLLGPPGLVQVSSGQSLDLTVPKDGLVIAEIIVNNGQRPRTSPEKMRSFAVKYSALILVLGTFGVGSIAAAEGGQSFEVRGGGLSVQLSANGCVIGAKLGEKLLPRSLTAETLLAGCRQDGEIATRDIPGGVEFTRSLLHDATKNRCLLVERFLATKDSVRWEIEVRGQGGPWSTDIVTRLQYPDAGNCRLWTAWSDPDQHDGWQDPLVLRPFADRTWSYNGGPGEPNLVAVPIVTIVEPAGGFGFSLVLSPEDILLDQQLQTSSAGSLAWSRSKYRIVAGRPLQFAMDLVSHPADWRSGLAWMVARYPQWFNPPNPRAHEMAGTAAYSADERHFDVTDLHRMAFRANWKCSEDFPYMGMFLPPLSDENETWHRHVLEPAIPGKSAFNSFKSLNDYSRWMRQSGFYVLSYFNVTEFGRNLRWPAPPRKATNESELWKDPNDYLYAKLPNALLMLHDKPLGSWEGAMAVDPGDPAYQTFLLGQAQRHLDRLPAADGICIDRMDWLRLYNPRGDDGLSWVDGRPARSLYLSWRELMSKLGPMMHRADKVIFGNNQTKRLELLRHLDGIYCEFGHLGPALNTNAILAVRKPLLCWTPDPGTLQPDPDAYFQRHLHLGVYPTAPYPGNNHCIEPNTPADKYYLDYGPLLDAIRGKQWVSGRASSRLSDKRPRRIFSRFPAVTRCR